LSGSVSARDIRAGRRSLDDADTVVVVTGAGISADSGVPTFRGRGGLWRDYRPEELATPEAFARDPRLVWEWYGWRRKVVAACKPNEAHLALARWAADRGDVAIITQNVDGLHAAAAEDVGSVLELHGSLFRTRCPGCGARSDSREPIDASSASTLPHCDRCGTMLRPDVVWFGEPLDSRVLSRSFALAEQAGACLVVGTSAVVQPAASIASVAAQSGAVVVEVNLEPTPITASAHVSLLGRAADIVPRLVDRSG
jgi:NAD-dependent deacetylase